MEWPLSCLSIVYVELIWEQLLFSGLYIQFGTHQTLTTSSHVQHYQYQVWDLYRFITFLLLLDSPFTYTGTNLLWIFTEGSTFQGDSPILTKILLQPPYSIPSWLIPVLKTAVVMSQACVTINMVGIPSQEYLNCFPGQPSEGGRCWSVRPEKQCGVHCNIKQSSQNSLPCTCGLIMKFPNG